MMHRLSSLAESNRVDFVTLRAFVREKCPRYVFDPDAEDPATNTWYADDIIREFREHHVNTPAPILGVHTLPNGRRYKIADTGKPYSCDEYPKGGLHIATWEPRLNDEAGDWVYIDNAPDETCARDFLRLAAQLAPLPVAPSPVSKS